LQTSLFPSAALAEFYRFAQFRNETSRQAWLVARIREKCLKNNESTAPAAPRLVRDDSDAVEKPAVLKIEAFLLAQRFHLLPEPERSALALFYLDFFTVEQIAELLKMEVEGLSDTLGAARQLLQESLRGLRGENV
jgi:DNA-directed RNA polymerase specialized sigma24 family protein